MMATTSDTRKKLLQGLAEKGFGAANARIDITRHFDSKQQGFLDFVLSHYVRDGVEELDQEKLTPLLQLKYHNSIADALAKVVRRR